MLFIRMEPKTQNETDGLSPCSGPVLGFTVFRVTVGVNYLFHGLARFGANFGPFVEGVAGGFEGTPIPVSLARVLAMTFPPLEFAIGLLLVLGLFTRTSAVAGGLLIALFTVGKCLQHDWQVVGLQLVYAIAFYLLLVGIHRNRISLDRMFRKGNRGS